MNLDFLSLVLASGAAYLVARTIVSGDVFNAPRDALDEWLLKGESKRARRLGNYLIAVAVVVAFEATVTRLHAGATGNTLWAQSLALALALLIIGEFVGHRYFVQEGLSCRICISVWTAAAVTASLCLWGRWPIVPTCVFGLATAGIATLLSFTEGLIATVTEGIDLDNKRKRADWIAEQRANQPQSETPDQS